MNNNFTKSYLDETITILKTIDQKKIDQAVNMIFEIKKKSGRIFFLGVGGSLKHKVSTNLICAIDYAKEIGTKIIGIVGKKDGYTNEKADISILIPEVNKKHITPHTEEAQPIVWHLIVSHPKLNGQETKWESL